MTGLGGLNLARQRLEDQALGVMLLRACVTVRQPAGLLYQIDYGEADQELGTRLLVARRRPD